MSQLRKFSMQWFLKQKHGFTNTFSPVLANIMTMSLPAASRNATETQHRFCMMVYLKFWADYIMHLSKPTIRSWWSQWGSHGSFITAIHDEEGGDGLNSFCEWLSHKVMPALLIVVLSLKCSCGGLLCNLLNFCSNWEVWCNYILKW